MGVRKSPDIFQDKMNKIFRGFEFIWAYIDELLIITKSDWTDLGKIGTNPTKA